MRPTNAEKLAQEPELEEGTEAVVADAQTRYPEGKVIEAEIKDDGTMEVTLGWTDAAEMVHIVEAAYDAEGVFVSAGERPDVPPGKMKPLHERKPHAKVKKPHPRGK